MDALGHHGHHDPTFVVRGRTTAGKVSQGTDPNMIDPFEDLLVQHVSSFGNSPTRSTNSQKREILAPLRDSCHSFFSSLFNAYEGRGREREGGGEQCKGKHDAAM